MCGRRCPVSDEADLLSLVVAALEALGVPYMVGGSVALAVWAQPRLTHDLDLVVDLPTERVAEFCRYFSADRFFIDPAAMRVAFAGRNSPSLGMYSFTDMETGLKVDLFPLRRNDPAQQAAIRRRVGLLTETPGLYESLSAEANLRFFARLYGVAEADLRPALERYLRRFDLWERRADRVGGFSKGMKQKVALIRALLHRPSVVFLDEPTAGLDPESAQVVHESIREMQSEGRTIFLCTHNLDEAERLCDRVAIFRRHIIRMGSPTELRRSLFARQMEVIVADPTQAARLVAVARTVPGCTDAQADGPGRLVVSLPDPDAQAPALVTALVGAGAAIRRVAEVEHSLESAYLELIQG